jgi:hypothetical protein
VINTSVDPSHVTKYSGDRGTAFIAKVFYLLTNAQVIVLKTILKFTVK